MTSLTLNEIGLKHDTDKVSGLHDFLNFYERRLSHLRTASFTMFEVGVLRGGSLKTWSEYFPNATVVGIDITQSCKQFEGGNAHVRIGNATDVSFLFDLVSEFGRPTVFLDDGSHRWDDMISTFQTAFPLLKPGGFYIVEDLDTSFEAHLEKAPFQGLSSISTMDYLYKLARVVTGENALGSERPYDLFISEYAPWIGSVEFGRRTAVISKKISKGGGPA
jgi:hypothetical protein